jgi:hypothetical protein
VKFIFRRSEEIDGLVDVEFDSIFEVETLAVEAPFGEKRERWWAGMKERDF